MKKVLIVASVVSFIEWFNKENIEYLKDNLNCEVHIACNFNYLKDTDRLRTKEYIKKIKEEGVLLHHIHFAREPINKENIRAYRQLKKIMDKSRFDSLPYSNSINHNKDSCKEYEEERYDSNVYMPWLSFS